MPKPASQAQAGFFGAIASGKKKVKGFSSKQARNRLHGTHTKNLPKYSNRSAHGSGEFSEEDIYCGYKTMPTMGD